MNPTRLHAIMSGDARDLRAKLARVAMSCAEPFYRAAVGVRNAMFDWGIRKPKKLPRPVISIGNITTGGTGKTPMVIEIVRRLIAIGHKPAVLLRGYSPIVTYDISTPGQTESERFDRNARTDHYLSDEANLLKTALQDQAIVRANPNRLLQAKYVVHANPEVSVFVLDDGFQHRQVARDLDIVLVDATEPFGFDHVLPRGLLRERAANLNRADAVIITRANQHWKHADLSARIERLSDRPPLAKTEHTWTHWQRCDPPQMADLQDAEPARDIRTTSRLCSLDDLRHQRVVAFCGIGNPAAFEATLRSHVGEVVAFHSFPDHFGFHDEKDLADRVRAAMTQGAQAIVMTEKDWVKWPVTLHAATNLMLPVYRPVLEMKFIEGGDAIDALLRTRLAVGP